MKKNIILKILSLFIPFQMVFYWPLTEEKRNNEGLALWPYIYTGFGLYILGALIFIFK